MTNNALIEEIRCALALYDQEPLNGEQNTNRARVFLPIIQRERVAAGVRHACAKAIEAGEWKQ